MVHTLLGDTYGEFVELCMNYVPFPEVIKHFTGIYSNTGTDQLIVKGAV